MKTKFKLFFALLLFICLQSGRACENQCYNQNFDQNCRADEIGQDFYTLHMSVHPHLDAYWIFNLDSYYDPKSYQGDVMSYFRSNRFNSVKEIFNTATRVLTQSKQHRQTLGKGSQKSHRSFFNSEMGFFKKWFNQQNPQTKQKVKTLLKTKYWEIVGGGFVQHDEGCAYYDDIIENFQNGLNFLKNQFNYTPKAAISADSFGHSQTTLAILAHLGIEGFFVERSDEHILLQNKTQFIWKAKSANGEYYGALPTHVRWAIHGFEDQFIGSGVDSNLCQTKQNYINNMRRENEFLKRILHSPHIMRYFGHDFQQFDEYSYSVIQAIMQKFSSQKCNKVVAVYGNPTEYFLTLMGEVFGQKKKPIVTREEDIFPIWDYDSGLYWTGYYTTDPYHKKNYRDAGRFLYGVRKFLLPSYTKENGIQNTKQDYETLEKLAEQVAYLQHHDGISGTSKYTIMDELQNQNNQLIQKIKGSMLKRLFNEQFDSVEGQKNEYCIFGTDCKITSQQHQEINLKIFNSAGYKRGNEPFVVQLPYDAYYVPNCPYEMNCLCQEIPCECSLYLYPENYGTYVTIKLTKQQQHNEASKFVPLKQNNMFNYNSTHLKIQLNGSRYSIGYKKIVAQATNRQYSHLSRYGDQYERSFSIRSGKYALGNDPNRISDLSEINKVLKLQSKRNIIILVKWNREGMKTLITINKAQINQWKVQTHSAAEAYQLQDLYLQVATQIKNQNKFYTDSNGWLVMKRELFHHEDYKAHFDPKKYDDIDGNSYPMTAFTYIQDDKDKVSINTDRPQGAIAYKPGTLWVNFDRLTSDDGKWVYQNTYRSDYQKFTHVITVQNHDNNERKIQSLYDMPIIMQISYSQTSQDPSPQTPNLQLQKEWRQFSGLNNLKTLIKPINDSTVLVIIHNLNDKESKQVKLFAGQLSPLLTAFYGSLAVISKVQERSLGNNMNYREFIDSKWNWDSVVDLKKQNSIFNKQFSQTITLRPLEIRTFSFHGLKFVEGCDSPSKIVHEVGKKLKYQLNLDKPAPKREKPLWQEDVVNYMLNVNHCNVKSPIIIDKKYPSQSKSDVNYHQLQNTVSNQYTQITTLDDVQRQKIQQQRLQREKEQKLKEIQAQQKTKRQAEIQTEQQEKEKIKTQPETVKQQTPPKKEQEITKKLQTQKPTPVVPQELSEQSKKKKRFIQIRKKIETLNPLTKQEKEIYFGIRVQQIQEVLKQQANLKL